MKTFPETQNSTFLAIKCLHEKSFFFSLKILGETTITNFMWSSTMQIQGNEY